MTEKEYGQKLLSLVEAIDAMANKRYEHHVRTEAGKRNQPSLHMCNGMNAARNLIVERFNKEISEEVRTELANEHSASHRG